MVGLGRVLLVVVCLALVAAGLLFGVLGVWGVSRGGSDAWILALLGALGFAGGLGLLRWAVRRAPRADP